MRALWNSFLFKGRELYIESLFFRSRLEPVYDPKKPRKYSHFSGKRVHRGLYVSKNGTQIHADLNGALNILRKAKVVSFDALYQDLALGGVVGTPERIKIT